jgi:hypothetical protein
MTIPTAKSIQREWRRRERLRQRCSEIIEDMRVHGFSLHCHFGHEAPQWRLSDGSMVPRDIAMLVITSAAVISVGDCLPAVGAVAQTYRAIDSKEGWS